MTHEQIQTGYAALQSDSQDNIVHGVAIGEDDETKGASGKRTKWPAEVLEASAEKFEEVPIVKDHPEITKSADGIKLTGQAPIDSKVGEITRAKYKDGVGVLWEGRITDDEMYEKIEDGIVEVSPVFSRDIQKVDDAEGLYEATQINKVRDLGLVSKGAAPSNSITTGAAALSVEALAEEFADENVANASNGDSGTEVSGAEALKEVAGVTFEGTATGKLDESEIDDNFGDHALYGDGENKGDYSYWVVDADGNLRRGNVESAWQLGCRGQCPSDDTHDERVLALAEEFDDPPIDTDAESMGAGITDPANWEACGLDLTKDYAQELIDAQSDDAQNDSTGQSSVAANSEETMSENELTDDEKAILQAAEDVEDATEALNEIAATEQATIVAQSEYDSLEENVNEVKTVLTEALSEKTELKDSTIEALSFDALCDEFRDDDGDLKVEALVQKPETGDVDEEGAEALGENADKDKAEALYQDYTSMNRPPKGLEDDITEALGVSDFDDAIEVLD